MQASVPVENFKAVVRFILRNSKRVAVSIVGFVLLAAGLVMLIAPGPGFLLIILGLGVLGTEYAWARRALSKAKGKAAQAKDAVTRKRRRPTTG